MAFRFSRYSSKFNRRASHKLTCVNTVSLNSAFKSKYRIYKAQKWVKPLQDYSNSLNSINTILFVSKWVCSKQFLYYLYFYITHRTFKIFKMQTCWTFWSCITFFTYGRNSACTRFFFFHFSMTDEHSLLALIFPLTLRSQISNFLNFFAILHWTICYIELFDFE